MFSKTLNNFEYHHFQNDIYYENRLTQMSVIFLIHFQQVHALFCLSYPFIEFQLFIIKIVFVTKFACANLVAKRSAVSLLNFGVVIYLS